MYPVTPDQAWANLDRDLRGFFDFTEDDLAANQQGELTPRQIKRIQALIRSLNFEDTAYTLIFVVLIVILMVGLKIWAGTLLLIVPFIYWYVNRAKTQKYADDLAQANIQSVTGPAWRNHPILGNRRHRRDDETEDLVIQGMVFKITPNQFHTIINDFIYTVYYLPASKMILSIECDHANDISREYVLINAEN